MEDAPIRPMRYRKLGSGRNRPGGAKKFDVAGEASRYRALRCFISVRGSLVLRKDGDGLMQMEYRSLAIGLIFPLASPNGVKATANGRPIQARSRRSAHASLTSRGWAW